MQNGEENLVEDFDLFWGMGPSSVSSGGEKPVGAPSGTLKPALMGSLWTHSGSTLEAYGHRHHVHSQVDAIKEGIIGQASPPSSRRPAWLPAPSASIGAGNDIGASHSRTPATPLPQTDNRMIPNGSDLHGKESAVDSKIDELAAAISSSLVNKLEPGVRGALLGQRQLQQHRQPGGAVVSTSSSFPQDRALCEGAADRAAESATAPLRSRLAALEEQMSELRAALERSSAATMDPGAAEVLAQQRSHRAGRTLRQENTPRDRSDAPSPRCSRPIQLTGKGLGGGNRGGAGGRCGNGSGIVATSLEESVAALAQRTGTLEGRHKQVQAKVALLDNAFGSKASDWAQTIKTILAEREKMIGGGMGKAGGVRSAAKSGKMSTTMSSQAAQARIGGSGVTGTGGRGGYVGTAREGAGALPQQREGSPAVELDPAVTAVAAATVGTRDSANQGVQGGRGGGLQPGAEGGRIDELRTADKASDLPPSMRRPRGAENAMVANDDEQDYIVPTGKANSPPVVAVSKDVPSFGAKNVPPSGSSLAIDRCARCAETEQRCSKIEARVSEWEQSFMVVQKEVAAAAANAQATSDAVKVLETTAVAEKNKLEANDGPSRQDKTTASANWASKSSVEKLANDLRQLSGRMRDGEDALALVDHGLEGVRDQVRADRLQRIGDFDV